MHVVLKGLLWLMASGCVLTSHAQAAEISSRVEIESGGKPLASGALAGVVVWLSNLPSADPGPRAKPGHFQLMQKDKSFSPHLLVVPLGSTIDFPNHDPFFHNVFSLYNGKRFDLGLYESGSTRAVRFDHEGVSYIFCNIHPTMSAVVVSLSTPYVAVSTAEGSVSFSGVLDGEYELHVWAEGANTMQLEELSHRIHVSEGHAELGTIRITKESDLTVHKNKFGEDYKPAEAPAY
jgi:plastocyanin